MKTHTVIFLFAFHAGPFLFTFACGPTPEPNVPPSPYLPNGEVASCPGMCDHLAALGCEEAKPTPEGETCEEVCTGAFAQGSGARLPVACIQQAASCAAAEAC